MGAKKKTGVKKLGGKKLGGAKKTSIAAVDWDNADAKINADTTAAVAALDIQPGQEGDALESAVNAAKTSPKVGSAKAAERRLGFGQVGPAPGAAGFGSTGGSS
eukprot:COSAG01_NODE_15720_length_1306_cov_3.284698_1_plen_103_part_10